MKCLFYFASTQVDPCVSVFLHAHLSMWLRMLHTADLRIISISWVFGHSMAPLFPTGILYIYGQILFSF